MEVCPSIVLNSDASENVAYNNPDFPAYDVNGQRIPLQTGEGIFVNSRCFHYGYSDTNTECLFICILLSPLLLSINTYFVENCLNPLLQNIHFPYQKLNPSIQWQNSILGDLEMLYEKNMDKIQKIIQIKFC